MKTLHPGGWPRPSGYSNGIEAAGRLVFVAGQVGWDARGRMVGPGIVEQTRRALENVMAVLGEAHAGPEHVARMTWYVADVDEYRQNLRAVGEAYRAVMGDHYPAMSLVEVSRLLEEGARVEIEATAVIPHAM
jgi:enamine deaminase RidA (YjgF/YER057c/UK114 family)